jgi:hypothetical protein
MLIDGVGRWVVTGKVFESGSLRLETEVLVDMVGL